MSTRLSREHQKIIEAAEALFDKLNCTPRPPMDEVSQLRAHIGSLTLNHIRNEAMLVVTPLLSSGRIDELPEGRQVLAEIHELRATYSAHIREWTPHTITQDWAGYTSAVAALIGQLKAMFAREEQHLHLPAIRLLYPESAMQTMRAAV